VGRFAEGATCCRALQAVYFEAGYAEEAGRYGELASRYEERAGTAPTAQAATLLAPAVETQPAPWPPVPAFEIRPPSEPVEAHFDEASLPAKEEGAAPTAPADEIDISEEWEGTFSEEPVSVSVAETSAMISAGVSGEAPRQDDDLVPETVEEIRF